MTHPKSRTIAISLALVGIVLPGLHKFYLGQSGWGLAYLIPGLLLATFPLAMVVRVASICDAIIYLSQGDDRFDQTFNPGWPTLSNPSQPSGDPGRVQAIAQALYQLESLRQEGLMTDYEFEQQRRQLLE